MSANLASAPCHMIAVSQTIPFVIQWLKCKLDSATGMRKKYEVYLKVPTHVLWYRRKLTRYSAIIQMVKALLLK